MAKELLPLAVNLDGTFLRTDSLVEMLVVFFRQRPLNVFRFLRMWLRDGEAAMKSRISREISLDWGSLPTEGIVYDRITEAREDGRLVVLATASNQRVADGVAGSYGLFDEVLASDQSVNLKGTSKAQVLVERFGHKGFDYIGNGANDVPVVSVSRQGFFVRPTRSLLRRGVAANPLTTAIGQKRATLRFWLEAARPHQWSKNLLVLLPALGAQLLTFSSLVALLAGVAVLSVLASSVYMLNDVLDVHEDRTSESKKSRPFASGNVPLMHGLVASLLFGVLSILVGFWLLGGAFTLVLFVYVVLTAAYSLRLKRIVLVDVFVLTTLYGIRIVAGVVIVGVALSPWLLSFSFFVFLSLALVKRYVELVKSTQNDSDTLVGRGYRGSDAAPVMMFGVASAFLASLVLALYIDNQKALEIFTRPDALWVFAPLLVFWMSRVWLLAHRRELDEDPVKFAMTDWLTYVMGAVGVVAWVAASW